MALIAPVIRAIGGAATGTAAIAPGLPTGTIKGDLLVMIVESGGPTGSTPASNALTASGWSSAPSSPQTTGNTRLTLLYKIATSGSDATTTNDTGDHQAGRIIGIVAGTFDASDPFNTSAGGTQTSTTSVSIPGATTDRDMCLVLACASGDLPDATGTAEFSSTANASLSGLTERFDQTVASGDGGAYYMASGVMDTAGTYNATTATAANAAVRGVISLAINPTVGPLIRAVGAIANGTGAISPGLPSGTVAGDLLVMFAESGGPSAAAGEDATTALTASGWSEAPSSPQQTGNTRLTVLYKIAVGSDATTTNDTGNHQMARIVGIVEGSFDAADPFNTSNGGTQTSTTSVSIPGSTTDAALCLVLAATSGDLPDSNSTTQFSAWANGDLDWIAEQIDNTVTSGDGGALGVAAGEKVSAGSYGATTATAVSAAVRGVISLAVNGPATGAPIEVSVTAATTTDTAQAVHVNTHYVTLGVASTLDMAGPIVPWTVFPGLELDAAQTLTYQTVSGGEDLTAAETTDAAQPLTAEKHATADPAATTDTARPLSADKQTALTAAAETDDAQPLATQGAATLGGADETDDAQSLSVTKTIYETVAAATTDDAAQPLALTVGTALTAGTETDEAEPLTVTHTHTVTVGPAATTDAAQPATAAKAVTVGAATAADVAGHILVLVELGPAVTTDDAQPLSVGGTHALSPAATTDDAQPLSVTKTIYKTLTAATTTDTASAAAAAKHADVAAATATDAAQTVSYSQAESHTITAAAETEAAQPVAFTKTIYKTVGPASTTDDAQSVSYAQAGSYTISAATTTDAARPLSVTHVHYRTLTPAAETDDAYPLSSAGTRTLAAAATADAAQTLAAVKAADLLPGSTTDAAQALTFYRRATLTAATETDAAVMLENISVVITAFFGPPSPGQTNGSGARQPRAANYGKPSPGKVVV